MRGSLALAAAAAAAAGAQAELVPGASCDASTLYADVDDSSAEALRTSLHALVADHTVVPYTSSSATDVWDALQVLDADPTNSSNVIEIYAQASVPGADYGTATTWNREHVFPKSYGVSTSGADTSDLLSLRAADWNVNSARNNLYYGDCFSDDCDSPAHSEAAADTAKNSVLFMPPAAVRGDLARSIFYMALRYDGSDANTEDLTLDDCPCSFDARFGLLTDLLAWHDEDPPDDAEVARVDDVCDLYQGNRNPFVDHPEYVAQLWTAPAGDDACPACEEDSSGSGSGTGTEAALQAGDAVVVGFSSDAPDAFAVVPLAALAEGDQFHVTDRGFGADGLYDGEGTVTYTAPAGGVAVGSVLAWEGETSAPWSTDGSFNLATGGDSLIVFVGSVAEPSAYVAAVSYKAAAWDDPADVTSSNDCALPTGLADGETAIALAHHDSYLYTGVTEGTAEELAEAAATAGNWEGSEESVGMPTAGWTVLGLGSGSSGSGSEGSGSGSGDEVSGAAALGGGLWAWAASAALVLAFGGV